MPRRFLYLIRHGQYDVTVKDRLGGELTALGRQQAKITAQALCHLPISTIHCSSMRRATETGQIIAEVFPSAAFQRTNALWECIPSVPAKFAQHFSSLGEADTAQCREQLDRAFDRYFKQARGEDKHELVVCHGNVVRYLICKTLEVNADAWANMHIYHCGISRVMVDHEAMFLLSHNEINHIPPHMQTEM